MVSSERSPLSEGAFQGSPGPASRLAWPLLLLLVLYLAIEGGLDLGLKPLRLGGLQDHGQILRWSAEVMGGGTYPEGLYEPPISVLLHSALGLLGAELSRALWVLAMLLCLPLLLRGIDALLGEEKQQSAGLRSLVALLCCLYFVQRDFRAVNSNIFFLALSVGGGLALQRGRPRLAGLLLASACVFKVYGLLLLPWLMLRGWRRRELGAEASMSASLLVFFLVIPALLLGPERALSLGRAWLEVLASASSADFPARYHGHLVSLHYCLLGLGLVGPSLPVPTLIQVASGLLLLCWLALVGGRSILLDLGVTLLLALLSSPIAQPAQGVVLLIPAVLATKLAFSKSVSARMRWSSRAFLVLPPLTLQLVAPGLPRAIVVNLFLMAALVLLFCYSRCGRRDPV